MKMSTALLKRSARAGVLLWIMISPCLFAQQSIPNTLHYHEAAGSPPADISAVSWVAGHWRGEAFGGIVEEVWAPPLGGTMMGAFKLVVNDTVRFYEIETIAEENHTLILRLKHFHANLHGWEEKDQTVDFRLVKVTPNKVYFDGFTLERVSENELTMYVVTSHSGESVETAFRYRRVGS